MDDYCLASNSHILYLGAAALPEKIKKKHPSLANERANLSPEV